MFLRKEILLRARITLLGVIVVMILITGKIIDLQLLEGVKWRYHAQKAQLEHKPIVAFRGNIYGEGGTLLATSLPFYTVALDPTVASEECFTQGIDLLSQKLSIFYADASPESYKKRILHARKIKRKYLSFHPERYISYEEKKEMTQWPIFKNGKFKGGVIFEEKYKRHNPFQDLAKRTIGVHKPSHGSGLEYALNQELQGKDGLALYRKVIGGNWKQVEGSNIIPPLHGCDIETMLDINLQDVTQSSLLCVLEKTSAQHGCAIVMEVATGSIKAIANLSRTSSGKYVETYNYAVGHQGSVEPGSTFKLVSLLALLEETQWPLTMPIDTGDGTIKFYDRSIGDVKKGGYGLLTLQEVFEKSSNVGIIKVIHEVFGKQPQKFIDYIKHLNLHKPLGIELIGEGKPYLVTPKSRMWNGLSLPCLSIGYGIQITPLQILTIYNAIANNGKMVKPMLVRSIKSNNGIMKTFPPVVIKEKICSDETLAKLKTILEGTVEKGLAQRIKHGYYKIAGKTGTAEKLLNGKYTNVHLTSFTGYFPADNPRYSCIIVIDSPQGQSYRFGADAPAPIFKSIVDRIAGKDLQIRNFINEEKRKRYTPASLNLSNVGNVNELKFLYPLLDLPLPTDLRTEDNWAKISITDSDTHLQSCRNATLQEVPNVVNMKLRDALFLLEKNDLSVIIEGNIHGNVYKQSVAPYSAIPTYRQITITLK